MKSVIRAIPAVLAMLLVADLCHAQGGGGAGKDAAGQREYSGDVGFRHRAFELETEGRWRGLEARRQATERQREQFLTQQKQAHEAAGEVHVIRQRRRENEHETQQRLQETEHEQRLKDQEALRNLQESEREEFLRQQERSREEFLKQQERQREQFLTQREQAREATALQREDQQRLHEGEQRLREIERDAEQGLRETGHEQRLREQEALSNLREGQREQYLRQLQSQREEFLQQQERWREQLKGEREFREVYEDGHRPHFDDGFGDGLYQEQYPDPDHTRWFPEPAGARRLSPADGNRRYYRRYDWSNPDTLEIPLPGRRSLRFWVR